MKSAIWALAAWLLLALPVGATSSLSFSGSGYWVDMEIGHDKTDVVASVRFHQPGDRQGVRLHRGDWKVESFDTRTQALRLRHRGGHSSAPPFTLTVQGSNAVLNVGGRQIRAPFNWAM